MRRPARGQPEEDQDEDDPTLIRVPDPDEETPDDPEAEDDESRADEGPAADSDQE